MIAFIAVAMMQPAGHWYCTVTKSLCAMDEVECCSLSTGDDCTNHSQEKESDPCCVEISGEWQVVPASTLVNLPEPLLLELFVPGSVDGLKLPMQTIASSWHYGGVDPPPRTAPTHALFCVRLV